MISLSIYLSIRIFHLSSLPDIRAAMRTTLLISLPLHLIRSRPEELSQPPHTEACGVACDFICSAVRQHTARAGIRPRRVVCSSQLPGSLVLLLVALTCSFG